MSSVAGRALPFLVAFVLIGLGLLLARATGTAAKFLPDPTRSDWFDWVLGSEQPARWLVAVGLVMAATTWACGASHPKPQLERVLLFAIVLLALASLRELALAGKRHEIAGVGPVWALDDDMMITLRYAANLADGHGLVWNAGERVEGITNLLWALVLAVPHLFLAIDMVALSAIVLNGALLGCAILLAFRVVKRLGGSGAAGLLAGVAIATHAATLHWAAGGSESLLLAVLLLWIADVVVRDATSETRSETASDRPLAGACVAGGLAFLTRPDALVAVAALLAVPLWRRLARSSSRARGLGLVALLAALPVAAVVFRMAYYGSPVPNTYWLKMTGWSGRIGAGAEYTSSWLAQHALPLGFAVGVIAIAGARARRRATAPLLAAVLLHVGYVVQAGGDELPKQRFFVSIVPLLFALAFVAVERLAARIERTPAPRFVPCAALLLFGLGGAFVPGVSDPVGAGRARSEAACVLEGLLIHANTQPDAKVAHFWAGSTAYFSRRPAIDFLGKCDPVIARRPAKTGLTKPGHNKYDFEHSLGLEPDVIVGGLGGFATLRKLGEWVRVMNGYRAFADLYESRRFADLYVQALPEDVGRPERMPQLVGGAGTTLPPPYVEALRSFHAIFVRAGTTRARPPDRWVAPSREDLR